MDFTQSDWGITVVVDLLMGGCGSGLLVLSAILWIAWRDRARQLSVAGAWTCFVCICVGLVCLLADVGQPLRAMVMPVSFSHLESWMALGAWFMFSTLVSSFVFAVCTTEKITGAVEAKRPGFARAKEPLAMVFAVLGILAGFMVTVYTGFLISSATGVPFWNTLLLPAGFCASAFYAATSVMGALASGLRGKGKLQGLPDGVERTLSVLAVAFGVVFAVVLGLHMGLAQSGELAASAKLAGMNAAAACRTCAQAMLSGSFAPMFWGVLVAAGLAVPVVLNLVCALFGSRLGGKKTVTLVIAAVLAVVGVFAWRFLVLAVGIHQPLASADAVQAISGATFYLG